MTGKLKNIFRKNSARGFTLVETLVAVMILASAVAGPLSIASRALNNSLVAKDQITAYFLAQDAIEYTRFVRDSNTLGGGDWMTGAGATGGTDLSVCLGANGCYVDTTSNAPAAVPTVCTVAGCPVISYDSANSRYTYGTGSNIAATNFKRTITLTAVSSTEYKLTVTVSWTDIGTTVRQVSLSEELYDWNSGVTGAPANSFAFSGSTQTYIL